MRHHPPKNFSISCIFETFGKIVCWPPEGWRPFYGESWIRPWLNLTWQKIIHFTSRSVNFQNNWVKTGFKPITCVCEPLKNKNYTMLRLVSNEFSNESFDRRLLRERFRCISIYTEGVKSMFIHATGIYKISPVFFQSCVSWIWRKSDCGPCLSSFLNALHSQITSWNASEGLSSNNNWSRFSCVDRSSVLKDPALSERRGRFDYCNEINSVDLWETICWNRIRLSGVVKPGCPIQRNRNHCVAGSGSEIEFI